MFHYLTALFVIVTLAVLSIPALAQENTVVETDLHRATEQGNVFQYDSPHSIANGATNFHLLVTNGRSVHLRALAVAATAGPMDVNLYEAPTISATGAASPIVNLNRSSYKTPTVVMYDGPTVISNGSQLSYVLIPGSKQSGGTGSRGSFAEFNLKGGTDYLIEIVNNSGGVATLELHVLWYEE